MTRNRSVLWLLASVLVFSIPGELVAQSEYNAAYCDLVAGTLDIHWEGLAGGGTPCTGIEYTNGTFEDASDGQVNMQGTSVSNPLCIGLDTYSLTMSESGLALSGFAGAVPFTLTREPGESCFVGHWTSGGADYRAHISIDAFPTGLLGVAAIPATSPAALVLLATILGVAGLMIVRRL